MRDLLNRYTFLQGLLNHREINDQQCIIIKQMLDELKEPHSKSNNQQKFVGQLLFTIFDGEKLDLIIFQTDAAKHIFLVDSTAFDLHRFLSGEEEKERNKRMEYHVDTILIAFVSDIYVQKMEWVVPWDGVEGHWFVTDDDTFQCCKIIKPNNAYQICNKENLLDGVYEFIQINDITPPGLNGMFKIAKGIVDLSEYSEAEILSYLHLYGHKSMVDFIDAYQGNLYCRLIAEMIFETTCREYESCQRYLSFEAAAETITNITGLPMSGTECKS